MALIPPSLKDNPQNPNRYCKVDCLALWQTVWTAPSRGWT